MKALELAALPWRAFSVRTRVWLGGVVTLELVAIASALAFADVRWWQSAANVITSVAAMTWALLVSQCLLLARTGFSLRMPRLQRDARVSVALYAALTAAITIVAWYVTNGELAPMLAEVTLGASAGFAYALLPPWSALVLIGLSQLHDFGVHTFPALAVAGGDFLLWAVPVIALLWLATAQSWRHALRQTRVDRSTPLLLIFRQVALSRRDVVYEQLRASRMPVKADIRGSGPAAPVRSLRLAFGGWAMPQTPAGRARFWITVVGCSLFAVAMVVAPTLTEGKTGVAEDLFADGMMPANLAAICSLVLALTNAARMRQLWQHTGGVVSLLALLPGLGDVHARRRNVVLSAALPTLAAQLLLALATLALALIPGTRLAALAVMVVPQIGCMALTATQAIAPAAGDRQMTSLWPGYVTAALVVLTTMPGMTVGAAALARAPAGALLLLAWLLWLIVLLPFMVGAWQRFGRRPQPFLILD